MRCRLHDFKIKTFTINKKLTENKVSMLATESDIIHISQYAYRLSDIGDMYLCQTIDLYHQDEYGNYGLEKYCALYSKDFKLTSGFRISTSSLDCMSVTNPTTSSEAKRFRTMFPESTEKDSVLLNDFVLIKKPSHGFTYIEHFGVPYLYSK